MGGSCFRFLRFIAVSAIRRFFAVVKTGAGPGLLLYSFFPGNHPPSSIRSYNWRTASREGLPPPFDFEFPGYQGHVHVLPSVLRYLTQSPRIALL